MNPVFAFLLAHWGLIITVLLIGSAATRVLDMVAKSLPQFPRLTHFAGIVDDVVIDIIGVVVGIGKLIGGTIPPDLQDAAKKAAKGALVLLACLICALGCGLFNSPVGRVIDCAAASAADVLAHLCPPPVTLLCTASADAAFEQACNSAKAAGKSQDECTAAGLNAAKFQLAAMQQRGVNLSKEPGQ